MGEAGRAGGRPSGTTPAIEPIAERWRRLQEEIGSVCARLGRDPDPIRIVAVSKGHPASAVREAWRAGIRYFGENRVQEAEGKIATVSPRPVWHLVGHLQTNKAARAARLFDCVESVDSPRVARTLGEAAARIGRSVSVLMQVNTTAEPQKHGCAPEELEELVLTIRSQPFLVLSGLMTLGPLSVAEKPTRAAFERAARLREHWRSRLPRGAMAVLSMGMSGDWRWALEYGADQIRIGTAIFGQRPEGR